MARNEPYYKVTFYDRNSIPNSAGARDSAGILPWHIAALSGVPYCPPLLYWYLLRFLLTLDRVRSELYSVNHPFARESMTYRCVGRAFDVVMPWKPCKGPGSRFQEHGKRGSALLGWHVPIGKTGDDSKR